MPIRNRIAEVHGEITAWRRDLHKHPELGFDLDRTAAFVAEKLRAFGCDEVATGVGGTGVVGVIRGRETASGRSIGLRADMDALPITERTGAEHASTHPGQMHACGHDGHMAMLLGAARYLAETRAFDGQVVLIFQPAEEIAAGANAMCHDGLMDRFGIDEVYGIHNTPGLPLGSFAIREGAILASADEFEICLVGKGGHAAEPHLAVDTTLAAAETLVALNTIIPRSVDPVHRAVLTVGTFETDSRSSNIIAENVRMTGTLRTLDEDCREIVESRLREIVDRTARAFGATARVTWTSLCPATINCAPETAHAAEAARRVAGHVDTDTAPTMPFDDFAFLLKERPGAYILLGNGDTEACHNPGYDFNDAAIPAGCSWFIEMAEQRLPVK